MNNSPKVNLTGLDGCRSPNFTHRVANRGTSKMTKNGVHDCRKLDGNPIPKTSVRTSSFANRFKLAPFCSYAPQNRIVNRKKITIAAMRFQSDDVNGAFAATSLAFSTIFFLVRLPTCASQLPKSKKTPRPNSIPTPAAPKPQCQLVFGSKPLLMRIRWKPLLCAR